MMRTTTRKFVGCLVLAGTLALSGCSGLTGDVYDAPLPGGADVGSDPVTLTAEFEDVLDLVPQSSVKVDNVDVGRVTEIRLGDGGRTAEVGLLVRRDVALPAGTTARLQQTSLLGEKYVALIRPDDAAGSLPDGAHLPVSQTDAAAEVERVLGALSLVLNGGGLNQFQEISRELQQIGHGRTDGIKKFLRELKRFVTILDERKGQLTTAIDGLAKLGKVLEKDKSKVAAALEGLSPGMKVLAGQRPQLVRMLKALDKLSKVTVRTLDAASDDIVADLKRLDPILTRLADAGADLPNALEILLTYPFPDSVLDALNGDYLNGFVTVALSTPGGCGQQGCWWPQVGSDTPPPGVQSSPAPLVEDPSPSMLPPSDSAVPGLPTATVPGPSILPAPTGPGDPTSTLPDDPTTDPPGSTDPPDSTTPADPPSSREPTATTEPTGSAEPTATTGPEDPAGDDADEGGQ